MQLRHFFRMLLFLICFSILLWVFIVICVNQYNMSKVKAKQKYIVERMEDLITKMPRHEAARELLDEMRESNMWAKGPNDHYSLYSMDYNLKIKQTAGLLCGPLFLS